MKARIIVMALVLCLVGAAVCFAQDAQVGTWKLNETKSKFAPEVTKNNRVVVEATGDNVTVTVDGTDKDGKATHNDWTGKFDGKDYPVTGDPNSDVRSLTKIDDHTLGLNFKKSALRISLRRGECGGHQMSHPSVPLVPHRFPVQLRCPNRSHRVRDAKAAQS